MGLERNRKDFEAALKVLGESVELLEPCIDDAILGTLILVIEEYNDHYSSDIDGLITERDELQDKIEEAEKQQEDIHLQPR